MRAQAVRVSETLYKAGDKSFADEYRALAKDQDTRVAIQAMLTLNLFKLPDAADVIKSVKAGSKAKGVALIADRLLAPPATTTFGGGRRGPLTPEQEKRLQQGSEVFGALCFSCHGTDGMGQPMAGAAPGVTMAPPLAGSPRVQAHRDYVIKVLLQGLTGPVDGRSYPEVMVPMGGSSDEWVAGIASYVRTSFGNSGGLVTPADVARVRAETAARKALWTVPELEASLPRLLDSQQWKLSASHAPEAAAGAATLARLELGGAADCRDVVRGGTAATRTRHRNPVRFGGVAAGAAGAGQAGVRRRPLAPRRPQRRSGGRAGGPPAGARGGLRRPQAGGGRGGGGAPVFGYPRGYSVQVSVDGTTWSKPVAEGKGDGARTTITFAPTRAKMVRITQTDTAADAPNWSIGNLRIYEAPAERTTQSAR